MPVSLAESVPGWGETVIQHILDTGHTNLIPADDPRPPRTYGVACMEPECNWTFNIRLNTLNRDDSKTAEVLRNYLPIPAGRLMIIQTMVKAAETRSKRPLKPPIRRTTAWERLLAATDD